MSSRVWVPDLDGGAVTPEGVVGLWPTADGTRVVGRDKDVRRLYPIAGKGEPEPLKFVDASEGIIRFTADGRAVPIRRPAAGAVDVVRVDLTTGAGTPVRTVLPVPESVGNGGTLLMTSAGDSACTTDPQRARDSLDTQRPSRLYP